MTESHYKKMEKEWVKVSRQVDTVFIMIKLSVIWMIIEMLIYGKTQPSAADSIMLLMFAPYIYKSLKAEEYEDEREDI